MAEAIIDQIVKKSPVSQIAIQQKDGQLAATGMRGKLADFQQSGDAISFNFTAQSLPWVLPPEAAEGVQLTKLGHRFSVEKFTARNLKPGSYELKIDGIVLGAFTDAQLATGIELQANDKTPQYQQALKVALLNKQRNDTAYHPLRDQYAQLKGKRRDLAKAESANDPQLEAKKSEFEIWYVQQKAKVAELLAKAKELEDQIYAANQPQSRRYELALVK
jgi:hypothetical protein